MNMKIGRDLMWIGTPSLQKIEIKNVYTTHKCLFIYNMSELALIKKKLINHEFLDKEIFKTKDLTQVKYLIKKGAFLRNETETLLHEACRSNNLDIVKYLIKNKKMDIDCLNNFDQTPLHIACASGHFKIVSYLLYIGANIYAEDEDLMTPLEYAIMYEHQQIINIFPLDFVNKTLETFDKEMIGLDSPFIRRVSIYK